MVMAGQGGSNSDSFGYIYAALTLPHICTLITLKSSTISTLVKLVGFWESYSPLSPLLINVTPFIF